MTIRLERADLAARFAEHEHTALPRAPLHSALSGIIARDPALANLLASAPEGQQTPVLLLAVVHFLVLSEPDHPLAEWYPNITADRRDPLDDELATELARFITERRAAVTTMLGECRVQTNEVGRCALFVPVFALLAREVGRLAHIDVGTSAGLTTLTNQYSYRYDDGPTIGSGSPLISCATRGQFAHPVEMPDIATAVGLDIGPLDLAEPDEARWLQACVWPDQIDRFERLSAAIETARAHDLRVVVGDAVDSVSAMVHDSTTAGHPVITTSWVLSYLDAPRRVEFIAALEKIAATSDCSWIIAESPAQTPELPHSPSVAGEQVTALTLVTWRSGRRSVRHLGTCHPHGYWLHWNDDAVGA